MGITGDRYQGTFAGHSIELVRENVLKTLSLEVDGHEVARASRVLPHDITLTAELEHEGVTHTVTARSTVKRILGLPLDANDVIEVDGEPLALRRVR